MSGTQVKPGRRFGRLEVQGEGEPYVWRGRVARRRWVCLCACGRETEVRDDRLKAATTRSCGCLIGEAARERLERHGCKAGGRVTPEYHAWQTILHRSGAPVARRWQADRGGFTAFLEDMGPRPAPTWRLVRIDQSRPFGPRNCDWVDGAPRRGVPRRHVLWRGRPIDLKSAASKSGVRYETLCKRLERGWPEALALRP